MQLWQWLEESEQLLPHIESASLDARLLAEFVTGISLTRQHWDNPSLSESVLQTLNALRRRRQTGEPIAYLLGQQPFYSLDLTVNAHTLIPRPETEELVDQALAILPDTPAVIADLGTGSGAIALALARFRSDCRIIALDRSLQALQVAKQNAQRYGLEVGFVCADWLSPLALNGFDLIVSNPPYIDENDPHLGALTYEPQSALVSADGGYRDLYYLIEHSAAYLQPGGYLLLEHGNQQAEQLRKRAKEQGEWEAIITLRDYSGWERMTQMRRKG